MSREFELVKQFEHAGRKCAVVKVDFSWSSLQPNGPSHNGYVEVFNNELKNNYNDYEISGQELTFNGSLANFGINGRFVGFDTLHYYNTEHPHTQTLEHVECETRKIAEELNKLFSVGSAPAGEI